MCSDPQILNIFGTCSMTFQLSRATVAALLIAYVTTLAGCSGSGNSDAETIVDGQPLPPRSHAWVIFDADTVQAEVVDTPEARERGLMYRDRLEDGHGMLFVFEDQDIRSFWMRNTFIPLDIAFLDRTQAIVDIQQMEPETEEFHESTRPAMFALEVPQGWFEAREIEVGNRARIVFGPR